MLCVEAIPERWDLRDKGFMGKNIKINFCKEAMWLCTGKIQ